MEFISFKFFAAPRMIRVAQTLAVLACGQAGLDSEGTMAVELAVSEAVTNIVKHAYPGADRGFGLLRIKLLKDQVVVEVADWGGGYEDVLLSPGPSGQTASSGYGLLMIRKFMDEVSFRKDREMNILTMRKFLPAPR